MRPVADRCACNTSCDAAPKALLDTVVTPNGMYGEGVTSNARGSQLHQLSPCPESAYIGSAALHEQLLHSTSAQDVNLDGADGGNGRACTEIRVFPIRNVPVTMPPCGR